MDIPPVAGIPASVWLLLLFIFCFTAYTFFLQQRAAAEQKLVTEKLMRALQELAENSPVILTDAMYEKLHSAMFAILDEDGHPVCCGFFVTPCGVALTAGHACAYARQPTGGAQRKFSAATYRGQELTLDLVAPAVGGLDVAVLRVSDPSALPQDYLPLPSVRHSHQQLMGAPVMLIHGSIAWNAGTGAHQIARDNGNIITINDSLIQYCVSSYKGHSGAALLIRSGQVIGLHSEGFNDLEQELSERSPSTSADAVRLDVPLIWGAVQAAKRAPAATGGGGARRRRQSTA
jgi:hypothetical protein